MVADIIFAALLIVFVISGRKTGFVRSVLGSISIFVCGGLTVVFYNFLSNSGAVAAFADLLKAIVPENAYSSIEKVGAAGYAVNAAAALVIYICVRIAYRFLVGVIDIAVPGFLNSLLGGVFGAVKALALVLAVLAVIYSVRNTCDVSSATDIIGESELVKELYENNILLKLI